MGWIRRAVGPRRCWRTPRRSRPPGAHQGRRRQYRRGALSHGREGHPVARTLRRQRRPRDPAVLRAQGRRAEVARSPARLAAAWHHVAPADAKTTVGRWCDTWLAGYGNRRESRVRMAVVHLKIIKAYFGPVPLSAVKPDDVLDSRQARPTRRLPVPRPAALLRLAPHRLGPRRKGRQARLRHASAKTTLDTYGHLRPDRDDTSRAAVAAIYEVREERWASTNRGSTSTPSTRTPTASSGRAAKMSTARRGGTGRLRRLRRDNLGTFARVVKLEGHHETGIVFLRELTGTGWA
jgi:hypothetical protein